MQKIKYIIYDDYLLAYNVSTLIWVSKPQNNTISYF
jgi:hypothetical protein